MPATSRTIQDVSSACKQSIALPNAANSVNTGVIDLGSNAPFPLQESFGVQLSIGAGTSANTKNINIQIADSNESNANFTNIATLATWVNLGVTVNYVAATSNVRLPSTTKRYIRAIATGEANGGNASDANVTIALLF